MNTAQLSAWVHQNQKPLAVAGAVVVGGLGLMKARASKAAAAGGAGGAAPLGTAFAAGPAVAGTVPYDSTASDVYNALESQLTDLQNTLAAPPIPVPVAPTSNQDWVNQAVTEWAKAGKNPMDLQAALDQYTHGQAINSAQQTGIGWTISKFGAAPEGTQGVSRVVPA